MLMDSAVRGPGASPRSYQIDTQKELGGIEAYPLKFTGDGGVFFGIWLVNLLLVIVTLGLYTPFARRRKIQYFYTHTLVAGSPLEFTGGLRRMVIGFLLVFGAYIAYALAANTGQDVAVAAFVFAGVALAPLLWASAMRFRLASTRWRGIRGRFSATLGEVYRASWPVLLVATAWAVSTIVVGQRTLAPPVRIASVGGAFLVTLLCVVRLEFNYASLLFSRVEFGSQPGRWKPAYRDFVQIWIAAVGFFLAVVLAVAIVTGVVVGGSIWALFANAGKGGAALAMALMMGIAAFLMFFLALGPARAYREARMFKLIWSNVGLGQVARFRCDLGVKGFVWLRIRNMLFSLITAGFYRPFAITSEYKMKTESVTLHVKGGLDQLVGQLVNQQGAVGDAIADAVGLDLVG
ncbi:MAG TPA: YjgN family protein [Ramlibacter sp.]|nr:YjgN family protein [Ramlibacter sp.]